MGFFAKRFSLLIVCRANITRSAYLHGYMNAYLKKHLPLLRRRVRIRSAGIQARRGAQASRVVQHVARLDGFNLSGHRSTPLSRKDLRWAHVILVMEECQKESIINFFPEARDKTFRVTEYLRREDDGPAHDIPDPTGMDFAEYNEFIDVAHAETDRIFRELNREELPVH